MRCIRERAEQCGDLRRIRVQASVLRNNLVGVDDVYGGNPAEAAFDGMSNERKTLGMKQAEHGNGF